MYHSLQPRRAQFLFKTFVLPEIQLKFKKPLTLAEVRFQDGQQKDTRHATNPCKLKKTQNIRHLIFFLLTQAAAVY